MLQVGDIVRIYAPTAGKLKYHLCVYVGTDGAASRFLFLNSESYFEGVYEVECTRVPCLPTSDTGKTVFSFNDIPRYNERQLDLYQATKMGALPEDVAKELIPFVREVEVLNRADREMILAALLLLVADT
jgi:hypothetical protein